MFFKAGPIHPWFFSMVHPGNDDPKQRENIAIAAVTETEIHKDELKQEKAHRNLDIEYFYEFFF